MKKKITAVILSIMLLLSIFPLGIFASEESSNKSAIIAVEKNFAMAGQTVDVKVNIENNPGLLGAILSFNYDSRLTVKGASKGEAFAELNMTKPGSFTSPCSFVWDGQDAAAEADGNILTLTFEVADGIEANEFLNIGVTYAKNEIVDANLNPIDIVTSNGGISVIDYIPGDATGDGIITTLDVTMIRRFKAGGYPDDAPINEAAADVNDDGSITTADITLIRRYIAGGYDVVLKPSTPKCDHVMTEIPEIKATCTEDGRIGYWHCSVCDKYFADAEGTMEINPDSTVVEAMHSLVNVEYKAPTQSEEGNIEYWRCIVCDKCYSNANATNELSEEDIVISKITKAESVINYNLYSSDSYLQGIGVENPNPTKFAAEEGLVLSDLIAPEGYKFKGWQTASGASIEKIEPGSARQITLNAAWEKIPFTVQYKSDVFIEKDKETYTVDEGLVLPTPKLSNYIFVGWTDDDGNLYQNTKIPSGTTGNITLTANWLSERNKCVTYKTPVDPIIFDDEENNVIYFTYEIGEIQNVPLYTIKDFGYISGEGITKTETCTYTTTITEEAMQNYAKAVANATTESSSWTLSKGWSDAVTVSESWCEAHETNVGDATTVGTSETGTWNVSSGGSGSKQTTTVHSDEIDGTVESKISSNKQYEQTANMSVGLDATIGSGSSSSSETTSNLSKGKSLTNKLLDSLNFGVTGHFNAGTSVSGTQESGIATTNTTATKEFDSKTAVETAGWNNETSYGGSNTFSQSQTSTYNVADKISHETGYGRTYITTGNESNTQGHSFTQSSSEEYAVSTVYSTATAESVTSTWTTQGTKPGYHRWIIAGTMHVFAVVGYDMETKSFFVNTCSIMDDETHEFEDYSYITASFNDNQNGVISFEVPTDVALYVAGKTSYSAGLKVNQKTGVITDYTGEDKSVIIPPTMPIYSFTDNYGIKHYDIVKIKGISSNAFAGNTEINAVALPDTVTEIPDRAFEGCTSLFGVAGNGVVSIGDYAFKGCTSIDYVAIHSNVITLGTGAFESVKRIEVDAANISIAEAVAQSKAKQIVLYAAELSADNTHNRSLAISDDTEYFEFNGYGKEYRGLNIKSDADKTVINKADIVGDNSIPLRISSPEVVFNQVSISANGLGVALTADNAELLMQSNINISSNFGEPMLCKNLTLGESNKNIVGTLDVDGKLYVCGKVNGQEYLAQKGLEIENIDENTFNNMLNTPWEPTEYVLNLNDSVGYIAEVKRTESPYKDAELVTLSDGAVIYYGDVLSITYTAKDGFDLEETGKTLITVADNVTSDDIYATVEPKSFKASWNTGTGYTITVTRTSSPYKGATTGKLTSGATIYYGDVLSVAYTPAANYKITAKGKTNITVAGNVNSSDIYAKAELNATYVTTVTGMDNQFNRINMNIDIYVIGKKIYLKGWMYDTAHPNDSINMFVDFMYVKSANLPSPNCPVGGNHGIDWVVDTDKTGYSRIMLNTNLIQEGNAVGLWDHWVYMDSGIIGA